MLLLISKSMSTFRIATIQPNRYKIDVSDLEALTVNSIKNDISRYISYKEITQDDLINTIVTTLKLDSKLIGDTCKCHETGTHIYQLCYLNMGYNAGTNDETQANGVSSYLVVGGNTVYGPAVFMSSRISADNTCVSDSVDLDIIASIIFSKFIHKAVRIPVKGPVEEITFYRSPNEHFNTDTNTSSRFIELQSLCNFNLIAVINPDDITQINTRATRLLGTARVHGEVILASKSTEKEYIDLDLDIYNKLVSVAGGSFKSRVVRADEIKENEQINGLPVVTNRFTVLDGRYSTRSNKCSCNGEFCDVDVNTKLVCTGCYRLKYATKSCQQKHWATHRDECLHNKESINDFIKKQSVNKIEVIGEAKSTELLL